MREDEEALELVETKRIEESHLGCNPKGERRSRSREKKDLASSTLDLHQRPLLSTFLPQHRKELLHHSTRSSLA